MTVDVSEKILGENINNSVLIKLKEDKVIRGLLKGFDQHMNLILSDSEEILDEGNVDLGVIVVRGDNVVMISPSVTK
jgi:small nuclear ribonucleoprotein|tara:strand:- start:707 stop:937 length:231 start_codon:yes stop_codon:yes gene_type:complete